jgi:hypothetical protein
VSFDSDKSLAGRVSAFDTFIQIMECKARIIINGFLTCCALTNPTSFMHAITKSLKPTSALKCYLHYQNRIGGICVMTEHTYKAGEIAYAIDNPGRKLWVRRDIDEIYYCKIVDRSN